MILRRMMPLNMRISTTMMMNIASDDNQVQVIMMLTACRSNIDEQYSDHD